MREPEARWLAIRRRLDVEVVRRRLAPSRRVAQSQIRDGSVLVDGAVAKKPSRLVDGGQAVRLVGSGPRYVSRAGLKLESALDELGIEPAGLRCLDAGSSTGGFTDCLLQRGAASVVAVDVGTDQLHERLRADDRVLVRERTDLRAVEAAEIGPIDLAVADLSFISLRAVLPALAGLVDDGGEVLGLVKPQFEAGRIEVARGRGVITDPAIWRRSLRGVMETAADLALGLRGATVSPITGASGNVEFFLWLEAGRPAHGSEPVAIDDVVCRAEARAE